MPNKHLVIIGCSGRKLVTDGPCPAIFVYDGPIYRILRGHLRENEWPEGLSIGILSAKYGLIGAMAPIESYEHRLSESDAASIRPNATATLENWASDHDQVTLILGQIYLKAIDLAHVRRRNANVSTVPGPIGYQLQEFKRTLQRSVSSRRKRTIVQSSTRPLYFLPDWDDFLDEDYNFQRDEFSAPDRSSRNLKHCIQLMKPERISDGVLVSLAQLDAGKGILRPFKKDSARALAPVAIHREFGLADDELAFGDCGAFSYIDRETPAVSTQSAAAMYEAYGFDLGASVDHIPVPEVTVGGSRVPLSLKKRRTRVALTRDNAAAFIEETSRKKYTFEPVGIVQALSAHDYGTKLREYIEMGYRKIALGGLVPQRDSAIQDVLRRIRKVQKTIPTDVRDQLWIHLFGIFRPKIQRDIAETGVSSFDSATYFRKSWLRSNQNYLGADGNWYAGLRIPMTSDPRTRKRLEATGVDLVSARTFEYRALDAVERYASGDLSIETALKYIAEWDSHLVRGQPTDLRLWKSYRRTLEGRIWETCPCPVCSDLGVHVVVFRGSNRNKRRGAHNTYQLHQWMLGQHGIQSPTGYASTKEK